MPTKKQQAPRTFSLTKIDKSVVAILVVSIVLLVGGFVSGVVYQKHVNNETPVVTPAICNCPMMSPHTTRIYPCC